MLHEVEERVCDEMINVSDNVHHDEVETAPFRQVVLLLDIDLQQFVVMKEEQVVTEKSLRESSLIFHAWKQRY